MSLTKQFKSIYDELQDPGKSVIEVPVREVLAWANATRRGSVTLLRINLALNQAKLLTVPTFENAWLDGTVSFELRVNSTGTKSVEAHSPPAPVVEIDEAPATSNTNIGSFPPANSQPLSVKPDAKLEEIVTHLLSNDYSQLPVMTSDRVVKGMVSWQSLGSKLALKVPSATAKDCMTEAHIVRWEDSMFDAIDLIDRYDAVLVRNREEKITGIITAADFSHQFKTLSEPFLILGEIESLLRKMIDAKFKNDDLEASKFGKDDKRKVNSAADLTFGEYVVLLEKPDQWLKLALLLDRATFIKQMILIKEIRNEVMHFGPDPLDDAQLVLLRTFLKLLQTLNSTNLIGSKM